MKKPQKSKVLMIEDVMANLDLEGLVKKIKGMVDNETVNGAVIVSNVAAREAINGKSGKGLFSEAVAHMVAAKKGGKSFNFQKELFSREQVKELLKKQIEKCRNSVGRMPASAGDLEILKRINNCGLIKF